MALSRFKCWIAIGCSQSFYEGIFWKYVTTFMFLFMLSHFISLQLPTTLFSLHYKNYIALEIFQLLGIRMTYIFTNYPFKFRDTSYNRSANVLPHEFKTSLSSANWCYWLYILIISILFFKHIAIFIMIINSTYYSLKFYCYTRVG